MPTEPAERIGAAAFLSVLAPYEQAFIEKDPERRLELLRTALSPTAEIWGPSRVFAGYEEIVQKIEGFARNWAACRLVVTSELVTFSNAAHFAMAIVNAEGRALAQGHSVVELAADGRIQRVLAFWSQPRAPSSGQADASAA